MIHLLHEYAERGALEDGMKFITMPYHKDVCNALQDCVAGTLANGAKNLALCIAPRHYKTFFGSKNFPAWCLAEVAPDCEFILTSHTSQLAVENAMYIRKRIGADWHMKQYPHVRISRHDKDTQHYFKTTAGGSIYAVGAGGAVTGFGAGKTRRGFGGAIIIDDPLKAQDARSEAMRSRAIEYYTGTLQSRRNAGPNTPTILIAQRLHLDDLLGWCEKNEPGEWQIIKFPALQPDGSVLNPITTTPEFLQRLRKVDPGTYNAQYQQEPVNAEGAIIQRSWWKFYQKGLDMDSGLLFATADTAYKAKSSADESVIRVWNGTANSLYCLDAVYGRWEFPELLRHAQMVHNKWKERGLRYFFIEDKASGTPLEQTMRDQGVPAIGWRPQDFDFPDDKVSRVQEAAWCVYGGFVQLPEGEAHTEELVAQCERFCADMSHSHDDHVDTLTMAVSVWRTAGGGRLHNA